MWNHTRDDYIAEQYVECPVCGHPTDPEDLKICTDCGREICRNANCGGVCGYSDESTTCDEYVCAECQDENGYCARCAAEPHINQKHRWKDRERFAEEVMDLARPPVCSS